MSEANYPTNLALSEPLNYISTDREDSPQFLGCDRQELIALIQELRSTNSDLLKRVFQAEQAIAEREQALHLYMERTQLVETALNQQTYELVDAHERNDFLQRELDACEQKVQRQQIAIETLTAQHKSSQERVAHLERECSLIQASYNEKSYQLVQTENTCQELRTSLSLQQHQTFQFKHALEKSLDIPFPSYQPQVNTNPVTPVTNSSSQEMQSVFNASPSLGHSHAVSHSKTQPIPPWSTQQYQDLGITVSKETLVATETNNPFSIQEVFIETASHQLEAASSCEQTIEDQFDAMMNLFFEPPTESLNLTPDSPSPEISPATEKTRETTLAEAWQPATSNINSPSPVVYPSRPPKRRKSLAAVELPTFAAIGR